MTALSFPFAATAPRAVSRPFAYKWPIAFGVLLGAVMELVDTSIVNVAVSHMAANLGASIDEITWVAVGYILAAVIVLPIADGSRRRTFPTPRSTVSARAGRPSRARCFSSISRGSSFFPPGK